MKAQIPHHVDTSYGPLKYMEALMSASCSSLKVEKKRGDYAVKVNCFTTHFSAFAFHDMVNCNGHTLPPVPMDPSHQHVFYMKLKWGNQTVLHNIHGENVEVRTNYWVNKREESRLEQELQNISRLWHFLENIQSVWEFWSSFPLANYRTGICLSNSLKMNGSIKRMYYCLA